MRKAAKIAVIGGGWAGLAAATELSAAGAQVVVFESARQLGGRARSVTVNGHVLDNGQHILIGAYHETLRLMQQVGASPNTNLRRLPLELNHPRAAFHLRLPRLPAPLHLAAGLLQAKGCTLGEKIRAARFMRALQNINYQLATDSSVAELLTKHNQTGSLRKLMWEPLCLAALNTAPENASAQIFANILRESLGGQRSDTDLLLPTNDLNRLFPDPAGQFITNQGGSIRLSTRVNSISSSRKIHGEDFDHVIVATSPYQAAKLMASLPEADAIARTLSAYQYEPIGCAYLGYPTTIELPVPMLGLEQWKGMALGQWVFDRGMLGGEKGVMSFVLSGNGAWDALDNTELLATLHGELEDALDRHLPPPGWSQVLRERRATFSCRPKLPRPSLKTPLTGIWLAGDYVYADYPGTLEGAVRSGVAVAHAILAEPYSKNSVATPTAPNCPPHS